MNDVFVRVIKLPWFVRGQALPDEDGNFNIYINERYPENAQREIYFHELAHVENNDFCKDDLPIIDIKDYI